MAGAADADLAGRMRARLVDDRRARSLGAVVERLREEVGISIDAAATRAGITGDEWQLIELGVPEGLELIDAAASGLGMDLASLEDRVDLAARPRGDELLVSQMRLLEACEDLETMRAARDHGIRGDDAVLDRAIDLVLEAALVFGTIDLGPTSLPPGLSR